MNNTIPSMSKSSATKKSSKTIEETFQKKTPHEHILHRPDMYIGSVKDATSEMWIYSDKDNAKIVYENITYVPGLYKIFDEILVNAADEKTRCKTCNMIKVTIDKDVGRITVWNNGEGIPVVEHKEHKILVPSMIFGDLLTSANYDDKQKKVTGGKNGLGAKLTNIFSTEFVVETCDGTSHFKQVFSDNMYTKGKPSIKTAKKSPFTQISFIPDFPKFGLKKMTNDIFALFRKRVYDIAMTTSSKVYFNGEAITPLPFAKYIDLYFPENSEHKKVLDVTSNPRWKICAIYDPTDQLDHQNISFVNSICTNKAGTHVEYVVNQVVNKLKDAVNKKCKGLNVKPNMIKENLIFFVDATIEDPEFNGQVKEALTSKTSEFGSKYTVTDAFIKKIIGTGIVDQIIENAKARAEANMIRNDSKKKRLNYEKLFDAHQAGKAEASKCTLFICEGDSARTFAMSGFNETGRDYYGCFPIRGKLRNVAKETSVTEISSNAEIIAIKDIIGLVPKKIYTDVSELRYGSITILTDQDVDGSHIKGLLINYIHHFWPSLLKNVEGFIKCLNTPIVKVSKGIGSKKKMIEFHSIPEYNEWLEVNNSGKGWTPKYFKGLGTSEPKEARECFKDVDNKMITYTWQKKLDKDVKSDTEEVTSTTYVPKLKDVSEDAITLAFAKKRENDRKVWLSSYNPKIYLDISDKRVSYFNFVHKELINFSSYDNHRSIPNIMDSFKPSMRKIFFGALKKGLYTTEIRVSQFAGYVAEKTMYHHGEVSLQECIIGMAQDFVGAKNNINLLLPKGQFGSRLNGGHDHASARYIFAQLNTLCQKIFIEADQEILPEQDEDGTPIEPEYYAPILPMVLINGNIGIGTGYSTQIEPCNPRDVYDNLKRLIAGEKIKPMDPWYRNFTGTVEKINKLQYLVRGVYEIIDKNTIHVKELPIAVWTENYKGFLDNIIAGGVAKKGKKDAVEEKVPKGKGKKAPAGKAGSKAANKPGKKDAKKSGTAKVSKKNILGTYIKSFTENNTDVRVSFTITFFPGKLDELIKSGKFEKEMKLVTPINLTNMHLFNEHGEIIKYPSYGSIIRNFADVRLEMYQTRKDHLLGKWRKECDILFWKMKFIDSVLDGSIVIFKKNVPRKLSDVISRLEELEFPKFIVGDEKTATYNYITKTKLFGLTEEEVEKLRKQLKDKKQDIQILEGKTPNDLWSEELDAFMVEYEIWDDAANKAYEAEMKSGKKTKAGKAKGVPKKNSKANVLNA